MKKALVVLAALVLVCSFAFSAAYAAVELKLGHFGPENHPATAAAKQFAENVEKRTNGEVKITVYPNNALGSPPEIGRAHV